MFPPRSPDPAVLAAVRDGFDRAGFTDVALAARLGCATLHDYTLGIPRPGDDAPRDALDVLRKLLLDGQPLPRSHVRDLLPPGLLQGLEALELVGPVAGDADALAPNVSLYPVAGLYIVSDLGEEFPLGRADSVFPAISKSGQVYLGALPRTPCDSFLEICSGTGIGALVAARTARHAWAVDITERSTAFARFNAALNGIANLTALQGDLYQPVEGRRFDRIVAHPPYVPAFEQIHIYRDGGMDGEELTRRVVAESPPFLNPGGRLYCTCVATERADARLEQRVREMLGAAADDFDVLVLDTARLEPIVHFSREVAVKRITFEQADRFVQAFDQLKVTNLVGCTIVLERHASPRPPLTLRRRRVEQDLGSAVDGVLRWEAFAQNAPGFAGLAAVRPRLSPRSQLQVIHIAREGAWAMDACRIVVDAPLPVELEASPQAAGFLAWCDGTRTVRDHLQRLVDDGAAPADAPEDAFAGLVLSLLKEGVLEAELPAPV